MSDAIKHECGLAYIRLLKPIAFYHRKYGSSFYGLNKLYLLMEKQHNRGQDGAGIATLKLNVEPGQQFLHRLRYNGVNGLTQLWEQLHAEIAETEKMYPLIRNYPGLLKGYVRFMGEVLQGHLRYGTQGRNNVEFCHPFLRSDINPNRNIAMAGNFNLVNRKELFQRLGEKPTQAMLESDLGAMIETFYHELCEADEENPQDTDIIRVLKRATEHFDGGYFCSGLIGSGDSFVLRDPHGIRPGYYYADDEIVVAASERPAIMTTFNVPIEAVKELTPGHALLVKANGSYSEEEIIPTRNVTACSFERIYFSRGSDQDIYRERIQLGRNLAPKVLESIDKNLKDTIVSFIPNTAEIAFYGLVKGLEDYLKEIKIKRIIQRGAEMTEEQIAELINRRVRIEKIAIKDVKMRTFITEDASRNEMVQHVYDITYGTVNPQVDTLVVIDDSIVRGTTLKQSIIKMLQRLSPKKIIIVSSAPQIRYPDCYGIDMSKMKDFIAFQAAIACLEDKGLSPLIQEVYKKCVDADEHEKLDERNLVKEIYEPSTVQEISDKIAALLCTEEIHTPVEIIYQSIEGLHHACPNHKGDWYFTGNYPTAGGNAVANKAFMKYVENQEGRGY